MSTNTRILLWRQTTNTHPCHSSHIPFVTMHRSTCDSFGRKRLLGSSSLTTTTPSTPSSFFSSSSCSSSSNGYIRNSTSTSQLNQHHFIHNNNNRVTTNAGYNYHHQLKREQSSIALTANYYPSVNNRNKSSLTSKNNSLFTTETYYNNNKSKVHGKMLVHYFNTATGRTTDRSTTGLMATTTNPFVSRLGLNGLPGVGNNSTTELPLSFLPYCCHQQIRWMGRNDGNRFQGGANLKKNKHALKKARKKYHKQLQKLQEQELKHTRTAPGEKAKIRRDLAQRRYDDIIEGATEVELLEERLFKEKQRKAAGYFNLNQNEDTPTPKITMEDMAPILKEVEAEAPYGDSGEYDMTDAVLDDFMGNTAGLSSQPNPEPLYLGHKHQKYHNMVQKKMQHHQRLTKRLKEKQERNQSIPKALDIKSTNPSTTNKMTESVSTTSVAATMKELQTLETDVLMSLPTDEHISLALRSYRDKEGTRTKPIGIIRALEYLIKHLEVPMTLWNEYTYTTLLTCCSSVAEGRRVFQMLRENNIPISAYSWSILVDIYAKNGDYNGCVDIHKEMVRLSNVAPTLESYTSLLAGCYRVCNDGRVPQQVRIDAAKVAWDQWNEMKFVGIEPDVRAYGAMLRIFAATGLPERALNVLEEMQQVNVKPTTLCFTSALRAIARSHSTSIRYERGAHKSNRYREYMTKHHGKMTVSVMMLAESAEVVQDDSFISALIMCAAEAGDVATAKAIYTAHQIRQLDQFRIIGTESDLRILHGDDPVDDFDHSQEFNALGQHEEQQYLLDSSNGTGPNQSSNDRQKNNARNDQNRQMTISSSSQKQLAVDRNVEKHLLSYGEREYGADSRVLSAILHACARAADSSMIGTMWQGRENDGYLCENSLRLINAKRVPRMMEMDIPGEKLSSKFTWDGDMRDKDQYRPGKRIPRKFRGVQMIDDPVNNNLQNLDESYEKIYFNEKTGELRDEFRKTTPEEMWALKYGKDDPFLPSNNVSPGFEEFMRKPSVEMTYEMYQSITGRGLESSMEDHSNANEEYEEMYFDYDTMKWKKGKDDAEETEKALTTTRNYGSRDDPVDVTTSSSSANTSSDEGELYFDYDTMSWKTGNNSTMEKQPSVVDNGSRTDSKESTKVEEELYFDTDTMKWTTREKVVVARNDEHINNSVPNRIDDEETFMKSGGTVVFNAKTGTSQFYNSDSEYTTEVLESQSQDRIYDLQIADSSVSTNTVDNESVLYFDETEMKWKTRTRGEENLVRMTPFEAEMLARKNQENSNSIDTYDTTKEGEITNITEVHTSEFPSADEAEFQMFFRDLQQELKENGEDSVKEAEARELFVSMKDEYNEMITMDPEELGLQALDQSETNVTDPLALAVNSDTVVESSVTANGTDNDDDDELDSVLKRQGLVWNEELGDYIDNRTYDEDGSESDYDDEETDVAVSTSNDNNQVSFSNGLETVSNAVGTQVTPANQTRRKKEKNHKSLLDRVIDDDFIDLKEFDVSESLDSKVEELKQFLPSFSEKRIRKILNIFESSLGNPPLHELVLTVREKMPDYITSTWLKKMSVLTSDFVLHQAEQEGKVNTSLINNVLELQTSACSLESALEVYENMYKRNKLEPTGYSDRLILQMYLRSNRLPRALAFKQKVEEHDRKLDIKCYGSLIDYFAKHGQVGSAILMVRECLATHLAPPEQASLKQLRLLCFKNDLVNEISDLVGKDPNEWYRVQRAANRQKTTKNQRIAQNQAR